MKIENVNDMTIDELKREWLENEVRVQRWSQKYQTAIEEEKRQGR